MTAKIPYRDGLHRLAQIGTPTGIQLVRILALVQYNRYTARPIEFDDNGDLQFADEDTITVTNLAEPANSPGQVSANTDALALDVEGRWIVFLRQTEAVGFPAKVVSSEGNASYAMREQAVNTQGSFIDKSGTQNFSARNLAELSLGPGAAVDTGTIVMISTLLDTGSPPNIHYVFDHPAYAKYLD
ncbi:MAG: hypothetical protein ACYSTL_04055 [Planctomycetota bacterium]|jgi:hypothetical protein